MTAMTPDRYVQKLAHLVGQGKPAAAIAFADRWWPEVAPQVSGEQFARISRIMEIAETMRDLHPSPAPAAATPNALHV